MEYGEVKDFGAATTEQDEAQEAADEDKKMKAAQKEENKMRENATSFLTFCAAWELVGLNSSSSIVGKSEATLFPGKR